MQPDPARIQDVREWLSRASVDLRAGQHDMSASPPLFEDVLFHCQQAAEKTLKGFLAWHDRPFRRTHDLEEIGRQCLDIDSSLKDVVDRIVPLTEYAWRFRYPGEPVEPSREEAVEALVSARQIHQAVLTRLPTEVRP